MAWYDEIYAVKEKYGKGNCSACCFRNYTSVCKMMLCESPKFEAVWWLTNNGMEVKDGVLKEIYAWRREAVAEACMKKIAAAKMIG